MTSVLLQLIPPAIACTVAVIVTGRQNRREAAERNAQKGLPLPPPTTKGILQ